MAVRSSAVCEDLPNASFAGQQDTYLNVSRNDLLDKTKECLHHFLTVGLFLTEKQITLLFMMLKFQWVFKKWFDLIRLCRC